MISYIQEIGHELITNLNSLVILGGLYGDQKKIEEEVNMISIGFDYSIFFWGVYNNVYILSRKPNASEM